MLLSNHYHIMIETPEPSSRSRAITRAIGVSSRISLLVSPGASTRFLTHYAPARAFGQIRTLKLHNLARLRQTDEMSVFPLICTDTQDCVEIVQCHECPVFRSRLPPSKFRPHVTPSSFTEYLRKFGGEVCPNSDHLPRKTGGRRPQNRLGHDLGTPPKKVLKYSVKGVRSQKS